jgi:progesterone-induced-blocking factor 1
MSDLPKLLQELNIDSSVISKEDLKILVTGIPVSESEDDLSESHSLSRWTPEPRGFLDTERFQRELKHVREDYERQLREFSSRTKELQFEKRTLEDALEVARTTSKNELRAYQQATAAEIEDLQRRLKKYQQEAPAIKERVMGLKEDLKELFISEEHYFEIKKTPEPERTIKDWVLAKVYETVKGYKGNHDRNRKELDEMRTEFQILRDKCVRTEKELAHMQSSSGSVVKDLERKLEEMMAENSRLHKQLDNAAEKIEENRDKVMRFEEVEKELKKELQQKAKMENQIDVQMNQIKSLTRDREDFRLLLDTKTKDIDLLTRDKEYLSKQSTSLQDKLQRLEDRNDRLEIEILESKTAAQNYLNKLLDSKAEHSSSFEDKFRKEISDLRDRHSRELDLIKSNLNEVHEKRVEYLTEAKESAERKLLRCEQDLKDKTEAYELLLLEFRATQNRLEESLQEVRSELRIKAEGLERTHNVYEETLKGLRHSKEENELLRAKVEVLRQEFYKAESKCAQENAEVKAQLAVARENLAQYALIEQELDEAIRNQDVEGLQAPTSSKRRIQQSLELAKQLKAKQKQVESLRTENVRLKTDLESATDELNFTKKLLNQTEQPYAYLIKQIDEKEKEASELRRNFNKSQQRLSELAAEFELMNRKNQELQSDIKQILSKKDAIENLKTMMAQLTGDETVAVKQKTETNVPQWFKTLKKKLNR